ncbi:MAG TPA: DUF1513 domain-containing protein [Devosia sp.]|nr:DUF1513 domain-containing protein [Devosia sp.]
MWERRAFLKAAGAAFAATLLPRQAAALEAADLVFATATQESPGRFGARVLSERGELISAVDLPVRGHDVTWSAAAGRAVVFARRPGTFAVVFDPAGRAAPVTIASAENRHFFGHGAFSADGRLLYATENDFEHGQGVIGVYDVAGGYRRIGEFPTYGVGPHEMILLPDGATFAVANGGIETHPDYGRAELNLDTMDPSLAFIDARDGGLIGLLRLGAGLNRLSIRHMAADAAGRIWFGCQYRGPSSDRPQLIGYATRQGDIRLIDLPPDWLEGLRNYVGGLAISADLGTIAASSPVGGTILRLDTASGRPIGQTTLSSTCGVAPDGAGFVASNGLGAFVGLGGSAAPARQFDFQFDEHLRVLAGASLATLG